jgi:hypothetical protein
VHHELVAQTEAAGLHDLVPDPERAAPPLDGETTPLFAK